MRGGPRFFARDLDATDAGIPLLDVGTSADLGSEPYPIIRLAGRDEAGGLLFDHTALAFGARDARQLRTAVTLAMANEDNSATYQELRYLAARLDEFVTLVGIRDRVRRIVDALAEREQLRLADGMTIECIGEHPAAYRVLLRDTPGDPSVIADGMGEGVDAVTAVDVALRCR